MEISRDRRADNPVSGRKQRPTGLILLIVALATGILLGIVPSPYVIEEPGQVFNTLGTANHSGTQVPLISISGKESFETSGSLDLLTVSVVGDPKHLPNWLDVALAWFDPHKAVVPVESVYPPTETTEERNAHNQAQMFDSQKEAVAAALTALGIPFATHVTVASVAPDSPASGVLAEGDSIVTVNNSPVSTLDQLRTVIRANGTAAPASIGIVRGGSAQTVSVTPRLSNDAVQVGIGTSAAYDFPFRVDIKLDDVGGPSAGMMFALGVVDKLTPEALTGGRAFAGTGTIDSSGHVGAIGGIRQKLAGAKDAGATFFSPQRRTATRLSDAFPTA